MSKKKYIINLEIDKQGVDLFLKIKADEQLEKFFSNLGDNDGENIVISTKWLDGNGDGLKFYKKTENGRKVQGQINNNFINCQDEFGAGLYNNSVANMAIFRAVGISKGLKLKVSDLVSFEELKNAINDLGKIAKYIYANYIAKVKVIAKITYEL